MELRTENIIRFSMPEIKENFAVLDMRFEVSSSPVPRAQPMRA
jgi:hypothetical protein